MRLTGSIDLPDHEGEGGFDHAAVHAGSSKLYVAHTGNNAVDVIDCAADRYLFSIAGLRGVAGVLVSEERGLVFTSNRGEDTVGILKVGEEQTVAKVRVGMRPNGLSFDPKRGLLLAANVGDPAIPGSFTVSVVDVMERKMVHSVAVPGRTRWAVFDPETDAFYINIADPPQIVVVDAGEPDRVAKSFSIRATGPHGLDLDVPNRRLYCACDAGKMFAMSLPSGEVLAEVKLSGKPDVIFLNPGLDHLYVAVGEPGVIDVFDATGFRRFERVPTELGAHTIALDAARHKVYAFLPRTHRAAAFSDEG